MGGKRALLVAADVGGLDADAGEAIPVLEQVEQRPPVEPLPEDERSSRQSGASLGSSSAAAPARDRPAAPSAASSRRRSRREAGRSAGRSSSLITGRFSTRGLPRRSTISPRGACTLNSRTRFSLARTRYSSPETHLQGPEPQEDHQERRDQEPGEHRDPQGHARASAAMGRPRVAAAGTRLNQPEPRSARLRIIVRLLKRRSIPSPHSRVPLRPLDRLEFLQRLPGSGGDTGHRGLGEPGGHLALLAHPLCHPL